MKLIDKDALVAEIERRLEALANTSAGDNREFAAIIGAQHYELISLVQYINTLEVKEVDEEPTSNDLEEAASQYPSIICQISPQWKSEVENVFKAGAQWQKEQMITKACVFLKSTDFYKYYNREFIKEFKKAMRE